MRKGFTIIELMVVLAIVAILSGIGMAFVATANKQFGFQATQGAMVSLLRYARSQAITEKAETYAVFDVGTKEAYGLIHHNVRLWHLEDLVDGKTTGAFSYPASPSGGVTLTTEGRYGNAFQFDGTGTVNCGPLDLSGNESKLTLDLWVYPVSQTDQTLIKLSDDFYLRLTKNGEISGKAGNIGTTSGAGLIPLEQWSHLRMDYEALSADLYRSQWVQLYLYLNDARVASIQGPGNLNKFSSIILSPLDAPFYGKMDEVKISVLMEYERYQLQPPNITITSNPPPSGNLIKILFDAQGNVAGGAKLDFTSPGTGETFSITVDSFGMVKTQ